MLNCWNREELVWQKENEGDELASPISRLKHNRDCVGNTAELSKKARKTTRYLAQMKEALSTNGRDSP